MSYLKELPKLIRTFSPFTSSSSPTPTPLLINFPKITERCLYAMH